MHILSLDSIMPLQRVHFLFLSFSAFLLSCIAQNFDENGEENINRSHFPDGFMFGTGTSAYQVEGAYLADGKGLNNWDVFSHTPGNVKNNDTGDIADNHYHLFLKDIELMHSLGVDAYRFSISWARILPKGRFGEVNPRGIVFYNKIIDNLFLKGIKPFVTIHHFDFPQELEDRYGAWLSPMIQEDFVYFAKICFKSFGDRVKYWTTMNEPNLYINKAYVRRSRLGGKNRSVGKSDLHPLIAMHNMLLSHAKAVKLYRKHFQQNQGGVIGIVPNALMYEPLRYQESDRQAVNRALAFSLAWPLDPLVYGDYPPEMRRLLGKSLPMFSPEEKKLVQGSIDFIGINHYSSLYAKDCIHSVCILGGYRAIQGFVYITGERDGIPIGERTGNPLFFVVPRGMEKIVNYVKERYNNMPMFITENGYTPIPRQNEEVEHLLQDVKRIKFHKSYLAALARAIKGGANVQGYFIWSLMDNFEWIEGYRLRYGLYYVDRKTLKRIPKLSAEWFANFLTNTTMHSRKSWFSRRSFNVRDI